MKKMFISIICFLLLIDIPYPVKAQPAWSRGIQVLSITHEEAMRRARSALQSEGYTIQNTAGDFTAAQKNIHTAIIACNATSDGKTYINIFVASTSNDANVPGAERVKLQQRMESAGGVTTNVNVFTTKTSFAAGEKITVEFSGMAGNNQDWISLVQKGKPDDQYGPWKYTEGKKSGTMVFDGLPPGEYEVRAYFNNGYVVEKRYFFTVLPAANVSNPVTGKQIKIAKGEFTVGEKIDVQYFNLPGNSADWIAISESGKPETQFIQWFYTQGKKEGMLSFDGLKAGNYEARLFYNNSYKLEDKISFKVIVNPLGDFIIKTDKTIFLENEPIKVQFSNSQGTNVDWVSIVGLGKPDTQYGQWFHRGALMSGDLTFTGLPAGDYEVRYYLNNGYEVKKRIPIRVVKR